MIKSHDKKMGKLLPYIFILIFIAGVTFGSVFLRFQQDLSPVTLTETDKMSVFINSFTSFLKPCLIIWVFGFTRFSLYFSAMALAYRGGILGFAISWLIKNMGFLGAILSTLPQNLIYFPFLLFLSLCAAGQKKKSGYFIILLMLVLVCALSALIDTFITSNLIKLVL